MKTGLTKKQKTTDVYYNAKDPLAEVYTYRKPIFFTWLRVLRENRHSRKLLG